MVNNDTHVFKLSGKDHFRLLSTSLFYAFTYLICAVSALIFHIKNHDVLIYSGAIILLIFIGPAFYLHYNYFIKSHHEELRLNENSMEIFEGNLLKFTINKMDVQSIELFMSPSYIENGISRGIPFHKYNYMEIKTSNLTVKINNLLFPNLKYLAQNFFDIKPIYRISYFANIE